MKNGVLNRAEVIRLLNQYRVDWFHWNGESGTKRIGDLVNSIGLGEMWLEAARNLLLHVNVAVVTVQYQLGNQRLELREDRQELKDSNGNTIVKHRPFNGSSGEKIMANKPETPRAAAKRGLFEELHFPQNARYELTGNEIEVTRPKASDWYPGLYDIYHRYHFLCVIPPELYKPEGYVEVYLHKSIFFVWRPWKPTLLVNP